MKHDVIAAEIAAKFAHIKNPKERRLAAYVAQREKTRHTEGPNGFRSEQNRKIQQLVKGLLTESEAIEDQIVIEQHEVDFEYEDNFKKTQDEREMSYLKSHQQTEVKGLKHLQDQMLTNIRKRVATKKFQREQRRELKKLNLSIYEKEVSYKKVEEVKQALYEHRLRCEATLQKMEERHLTQVKQFASAEERRVKDQKILMDLQVRHLTEDQKAEAAKEHASRLGHQKTIDKKKLDQLREQQRLEIRHFKDKVDYETRMMEEFSKLQTKQAMEEFHLRVQQKDEFVVEKERMNATAAQVKQMALQNEHLTEIRRLQVHHRVQLRVLKQEQQQRREKRVKEWSAIVGRDLNEGRGKGSGSSSKSGSVGSRSGQHSAAYTRQSSEHNVKNNNKQGLNLLGEFEDTEEDTALVMGTEQMETSKQQLQDLKDAIEELRKRHDDILYNLQNTHQEDFKKKEEEYQKALMELEWEQEIEVKDLKKANEAQIDETLALQQREIAMDAKIRLNETRQLQERKILGQILDGVDDAVISIDLRGFITRFNAAASQFWGYTSKEILGRNIKELMPKRYSKNHDQYLFNFLKTGIKKVIGTRREVEALRKDGTEFPCVLTITEVVEEGVRFFNAFVRDISAEYHAVKEREAEEACLPQMIWKVNTKGDAYYLNQRFIDYTGVSEGNVFDPAVVQPDDARKSWKVFQEANLTKESFECRRRLKGVDGNYRWFLTRGSPIFDENNNIISWCGSCTDVHIATKLQVEAEALPEALPLALWKADKEGNVLYANSNFLQYVGAKKIDGLSVLSPDVVHKDDVEKSKAIFAEAVANGSSFKTRRRLLGANAQYRWFLTRGSPVKDDDGNVLAVYGTCSDVHDETLQAIEMAALPESLPQLVWKADARGNVRYANSKFMKFVGATEYTGLNVFSDEVVHPDDYKASLQAFKKGTKEKGEFRIQRRLRNKHGEYRKMQTIGVPIMDDDKNILGWYGTCTQL